MRRRLRRNATTLSVALQPDGFLYCMKAIILLNHLLSFSSLHAEPFEEDVMDTDSFPPNPPKVPPSSSSRPPVVQTSFSPTSNRTSSNATTGPGTSFWCPFSFSSSCTSLHSSSCIYYISSTHHATSSPPCCSLLLLCFLPGHLDSPSIALSLIVMRVRMEAVCQTRGEKQQEVHV